MSHHMIQLLLAIFIPWIVEVMIRIAVWWRWCEFSINRSNKLHSADVWSITICCSWFWDLWKIIFFIIWRPSMRRGMIDMLWIILFVKDYISSSWSWSRCWWIFNDVLLPNFVQISLCLFGYFLRAFCIFCCSSQSDIILRWNETCKISAKHIVF